MPSPKWCQAWIETDLPLGGGRATLVSGEPSDAISGSHSDWPALRNFLDRWPAPRRTGRLPTRAAIGYFTYEGDFWFGLHENIQVLPSTEWPNSFAPWRASPATSSLTPEEYAGAVLRIHEYIRAGDIYQVNLTRTLTADFTGSPGALFSRMREISPAPFSAFLSCPGRHILSASPELFLRIDGLEIETRPIKGTRPRYQNEAADRAAAAELTSDPKEIAELIMITDLERNDLGRVCEFGSVNVSHLTERQSFAQVHHLVSTVRGRLRGHAHPLDALDACFPGGSITGAPKKRAMEIISEIEPCPRGLYTGAIGFFGFDGLSQFNIAIRTIEIADGRARFGVGSGITIDSNPRSEFEETCHKASGIEAALYDRHP